MGKTNTKHKKQPFYEYDYDDRGEKKKRPNQSRKHSKQIDNLLRSKNVNRLLDYSEDKY